MDYLAVAILAFHGIPQQIRDDYQLLIQDAEDNGLHILKDYLERHVLPGEKNVIVRVGNFGEVVAIAFLIEFENFWFPIDKLRFREKKDWAMRLTDLCFIKRIGQKNH